MVALQQFVLEAKMPIMAARERNDARGAAGLLASTARDCLLDPVVAPGREVALNNVYRLLEAYRANALFGLGPVTTQAPPGVPETLALLPPAERHVKEVRQALERAMAAAFEDLSKEQAIELMTSVLRGVAYPQQFDQPSEEERAKAVHFFELVLQHLNLT